MPCKGWFAPGLCGLLLLGSVAAAAARVPLGEERTAVGAASSAAGPRGPVVVPAPSPLALDYYRSGNALWLFGQVWTAAILAVFLVSGGSAKLRTLAETLGRLRILSIGVYAALYTLLMYLVDLPLHFYAGFVRQHAYGLSNQSPAKWFDHSLKGLGIATLTGFALAWIPYHLMARRPRSWWFITALLSVPFLCLVTLIKPIWIDPLFNEFGPMRDQALEREIRCLADRAGVAGSRVYEVRKSADTKALNAYVTGLFETKRIVLWDTLLAKLDAPQVLAVVGHELGHYVLGHIPRSIVLSTILTMFGLWWIDRAGRGLIRRHSSRFGFDRLDDVASVPLLLLLLQAASLGLGPVANVYSRYQEHEADRYALELTHANRAAAEAFVALQLGNLSNPRPGLGYKVWRSTHPSIAERVDFCNRYRPWDKVPAPAAPGRVP